MIKEYLKHNWRKLDNTAKIFSLDDKNNVNIFRYSVVLKEKVDKHLLDMALQVALETMKAFKVKIKSGLFWNYLEYNDKIPIVIKDNDIPCQLIDFKKNNDYLFKVTYYDKTINLDILHILTDGTGAIKFLKLIVYNYLGLKYNLVSDKEIKSNAINYHDQYLKNYDKNLISPSDFKGAYQIPGKISNKVNNTSHYIIGVDKIKKVCRRYKVTITEYLTAAYIYALYLSVYNKKSKKDIAIHVPINLRKYYLVDTPSNFFVCMNIRFKVSEFKVVTFKNVLRQVHQEFQEKLKTDKVKEYLSRDVKLGSNIPVRLVPLPIKRLFIRVVGTLFTKSSTSALSNIGVV